MATQTCADCHEIRNDLEVVAEPDIEEIRVVDIAARSAFQFAVGKGIVAQAELRADAVGDPTAAQIFCQGNGS